MPRASERPLGSRARPEGGVERTAGIVLAAGASRRMGKATNKLVLEVDGEPMIRRVVRRALAAGLDPVVVVLGHEPERVRKALHGLECTYAVNPDTKGPTSGSLHAGLRALDESIAAAVVMLGDMVLVTTDMMRALPRAVGGTDAPLAVSRYGTEGVTAPPMLFRRELWPELLAWTGDGPGKAVVSAHRDDAVWVDWPAHALRDVDTPADFQALNG